MRYKYRLRITAVCFFVSLMISLQAQEKQEKQAIKLELTYQKNDESPVLRISTKAKIKKKLKTVEGVEVNLFMGDETAKGFLGKVVTDKKGMSSLVLSGKTKSLWGSSSAFKFIATVTANNRFDDASTEIEITKAKIEVVLTEKDSTRSIHARVLAKKDTAWVAVPETEIKFVVKRLFNDLSIGESASTTDADGNASTDFKLNIPGDPDGNILVAAKIDENDLYGNVQSIKIVKWGTPLAKNTSFNERTLFSTRDKTPLWLLIFPNLIIITVWCIIFYLIKMIMKIRRIGMNHRNA